MWFCITGICFFLQNNFQTTTALWECCFLFSCIFFWHFNTKVEFVYNFNEIHCNILNVNSFIKVLSFLKNRIISSICPTRKTRHRYHSQKYCNFPIKLEPDFIKWIRKWIVYNCFWDSLAWVYAWIHFFLRDNFHKINS